jgi:uncharacterized membrane protein YfcA
MDHFPLLFLAALCAGFMNGVAGGGSFLTFPALVYTGVPSVIANASSTVALFPGTCTSAWTFRGNYRGFTNVSFSAKLAVSVAGGITGALLLLYTPSKSFDFVVPWLLLVASVVFYFGPRLALFVQEKFHVAPGLVLTGQFLVAIYGGYFGGAVGLMMLALWSLFSLGDLKSMSATRVLLVSAMNGVAVVCFILAGIVLWPQTLVMLVAAVIGGYLGARLALRLNAEHLRTLISLLNVAVTIAFFYRAYGRG